jgi:hypothetical protein
MFGNGEEFVKAFIYNKQGYHTPGLTIRREPIQIASFIKVTKEAPKIVITDIDDNLELDTMYGFINICADQKYLKEELLPILIPMQEGKKKPISFEILDWGASEENNYAKVMIPFIKEKFNVEIQGKCIYKK